MIVGPAAVKPSQGNDINRPRGGRLRRGRLGPRAAKGRSGWLEGWALVLPSVGLALVAAMIALPRGVEPKWVPEPVVHPRELALQLRRTAGLAAQARTRPLPFALRELGEIYRRLGRTQYETAKPLAAIELEAWRSRVRTVQASVGSRPVLQLRALQCELLVAAIRHWQSSGVVGEDLVELGGDLVRVVQGSRWPLSEAEHWALSLKRWTSLAGLSKHDEFNVGRDVELTQLHYFYEHPANGDDPFETRIRILKRYGDLDPTYPLDYGLGVLLALNGRIDGAVTFFARQLEQRRNAAFSLRARNHLIWATRQLTSGADERR
jgi:hypothetical protein